MYVGSIPRTSVVPMPNNPLQLEFKLGGASCTAEKPSFPLPQPRIASHTNMACSGERQVGETSYTNLKKG